jgi:alpha-beta hydrolase superfamily lysophospholipase
MNSHGYGSYVGKFAFYAKIFQEQGFDVIGMDVKGFGHSEGLRGFIEDRQDFYEEGLDFILRVRKFYQDTYQTVPPIFTMGYS